MATGSQKACLKGYYGLSVMALARPAPGIIVHLDKTILLVMGVSS